MSTLTDSVTSATAPTNTSPAAAVTPTLTASDFLQILVAEFQNQDPTSPTDPTQYASQMVEFSNLGQLQSINQDLQSNETPQTSLMQAASAYHRTPGGRGRKHDRRAKWDSYFDRVCANFDR